MLVNGFSLGRDYSPAGEKSQGYVTATTPPPLGSGNFQRRMRESMQASAVELLSVVSVTFASATPPAGSIVKATATLPARLGFLFSSVS